MRDKSYGILVDVIKERTPREMKTKTAVLNGKPNAGNPHDRIDEGAVASYLPSAGRLKGGATRGAKLRRGSPLYMKQVLFGVAFALAATGSAVSAQLPDEYQEVESLTAYYGQYVDTGYAVMANSEFRFKFAIARTTGTSDYRAVFGTYTAEDTKCTRIICNGSSATSLLVYFNCIAGKDGTFFGSVTEMEDLPVEGYMNASEAKLNDVTHALKASSTGPDDGRRLFLFAAGAGQCPMKVTIYSFSVLEGGETVHDYVPCYRKGDLKTGMYDVKTGIFLPTQFGTHASAQPCEMIVGSPAAAAPVYTVTLPNGATNTLSEAFSLGLVSSSEGTASREGLVAAGDLRITGGGRLEINEDLKSEGFAGEIHVLPGATLRLTANGALGDTVHGTFVEDGATLETECLDSSANNKLDFAKEHLTFAGRGVGGVGALVARTPAKQERNGVWGGTYLTMTGDAMISAVAGYQDFPNNSSDNSLDMNGHVLTVRGFDTATGGVPSSFCLRPVVTNPGHIAITNCEVSINDLALLPGGEEHKLILLNRGALELYENKRFGRKGWTLYAPNPNTTIRMTLCGIWDGPLVADHDVFLTLVSQKNSDGSVLTNSTYLAGKITVLGNFSVRNDSSPWATPTLTLSALEQEFQNQLFEIGSKILLKFSDEGDIGGAKSVMKFTDEAIVSGGSTGSWSGLVKEGNGDVAWESNVGFRTLDLNAGRLTLSQALPDVAFYAGLSYSFSSDFDGWSSGEKQSRMGYYADLSLPTNKFVLDFADVRTTATARRFPGGTASYWAGYIMNNESTNVTWRFASCIRYLALLRINGTAIISKQGAGEIAFGNATLRPGANSFVIHSGSDGDCYTYVPSNCATWTNGYAVAVCKTSLTSQDSADFEALSDPGDGSVLRCALGDTPLWTELGEAWSNRFFTVERLTGAAGTTLDMGNRQLHVERMEGVPTVEGRTDCVSRCPELTVTKFWSVFGDDLAAGRGLVCGPKLVFGVGAVLEIIGGKALRKSGKVTVVESDNPIVGMPEVVSTDGSEIKISKSIDGRKIFLEYVHKGLLTILR